MKIVLSRGLAVASALVVAACAESSSPGQPSGPGSLSVAITPSPATCYPRPSTPCVVNVEAVVSNSAGRPLVYAWSGCASGAGKTASCLIQSPGNLAVSVRVTDIRGQSSDATGTATGTNLPPTATITDNVLFESWNPATGGGSFEVDGFGRDPEVVAGSACGPSTRTVSGAGICTNGYSRCSIGALDIAQSRQPPQACAS